MTAIEHDYDRLGVLHYIYSVQVSEPCKSTMFDKRLRRLDNFSVVLSQKMMLSVSFFVEGGHFVHCSVPHVFTFTV